MLPKKVLVLGISGMLGHTLFNYLSSRDEFITYGTVRKSEAKHFFSESLQQNIFYPYDFNDISKLEQLMIEIKPDIVINCAGVIKHLNEANQPLRIVPINSLLPHHLADICEKIKARLILISTDCVFDGQKGMYKEEDKPNASDLYGISKYIGEIIDKNHVVTIRTSIIGQELNSANGLVEWFFHQKNEVKGFAKAIFSGFPTITLSKIIANDVIPNETLYGLYHVSAPPIDKYSLLCLINERFGKGMHIHKDEDFVIDRSLNSEKFQKATGFQSPSWDELVSDMKNDWKTIC